MPHPPLTPWTKTSWRTASGFFAQTNMTLILHCKGCIPMSLCGPTFLLPLLVPASLHPPTCLPRCRALLPSDPHQHLFPPMEGVLTYGQVYILRLPTLSRPSRLQRTVLTLPSMPPSSAPPTRPLCHRRQCRPHPTLCTPSLSSTLPASTPVISMHC
jgi:hypothetical protein